MKGYDGPVCGAKTRQSKTACQRQAGWGTDHPGAGQCKQHGGATATNSMKAHVQLARREYAVMGIPLDHVNPSEAILECIRITAGEVQYASERIAELDAADALVEDRVDHERPLKLGGDDGEDPDTTVTEVKTSTDRKLHAWIRVRQEAMDRLVAYSATALKANVDERLVRVAESQAKILADAMRAFVIAMGFDPADPKVREALRGSLTALPTGGAVIDA